jgi:hypothetical protein
LRKTVTLALLMCSLALASCTTAQTAAVSAAVEKKQQFNDRKAALTIIATCDITVGAFFRLPPWQQRAVEAICGGEPIPKRPVLAPDPLKE